jgi:exosortase A
MSAIPADLAPDTSAWRRALPMVVGLVAAILWLYRDTGMAMVDVWLRSDTFAHGILVAPISLWLIWRQRARLAALTPQPQPWVLLPMAGLALLWLASDLVVVNAPAQFALVGLLILAVPAVLGWQVMHAILFPLLFLFFAVPFGEFMVPPMMEWTADFVVAALQWTGVPVFREGLHFVIPSGQWSVITECSGVRYLMASFMVGSLFAYLNYRSYTRRAVFMAVSLLMPILANWLRAYIIVMLGHLSGNKIAAGVDHILYGWVFFGAVIFVMFMVGMRWAQPDDPEPAPGAGAAGHTGAGRPWATLAAALALVALPHAVMASLQASDASAAEPRLALPASLGADWQPVAGDEAERIGWTPNYLNPSAAVQQAYAGPAGTVGVYVAYYRAQDAKRKLVNSLNGLLSINERVWRERAAGKVELPGAGGTVVLRQSRIEGPAGAGGVRRPDMQVWHAYWVDGRLVAGERDAKLAGAWSRVQGRGDDGAVVVLYADEGSPERSRAALDAFARAHWATLADALARTRDTR